MWEPTAKLRGHWKQLRPRLVNQVGWNHQNRDPGAYRALAMLAVSWQNWATGDVLGSEIRTFDLVIPGEEISPKKTIQKEEKSSQQKLIKLHGHKQRLNKSPVSSHRERKYKLWYNSMRVTSSFIHRGRWETVKMRKCRTQNSSYAAYIGINSKENTKRWIVVVAI